MTSHYLNQWWLVYWCIYASISLNELTNFWEISREILWYMLINVLEGITVKSQDYHGISNHWHNCFFNSLVRLTAKKSSKLCITGHLWRESTGDQWIFLIKGQWFRKQLHVMILSYPNFKAGLKNFHSERSIWYMLINVLESFNVLVVNKLFPDWWDGWTDTSLIDFIIIVQVSAIIFQSCLQQTNGVCKY